MPCLPQVSLPCHACHAAHVPLPCHARPGQAMPPTCRRHALPAPCDAMSCHAQHPAPTSLLPPLLPLSLAPGQYTYEKEIVMYAYFKKLDYFSTGAPPDRGGRAWQGAGAAQHALAWHALLMSLSAARHACAASLHSAVALAGRARLGFGQCHPRHDTSTADGCPPPPPHPQSASSRRLPPAALPASLSKTWRWAAGLVGQHGWSNAMPARCWVHVAGRQRHALPPSIHPSPTCFAACIAGGPSPRHCGPHPLSRAVPGARQQQQRWWNGRQGGSAAAARQLRALRLHLQPGGGHRLWHT